MYQVSDAYKAAMVAPVQQGRLRGTVQSGLRVFNFTEKNIKKGTFKLSHQCSSEENFEIGTVYMAELECTLMNLDVPQGGYSKASITPSFQLKTSEGYEAVPLGIFNIKDALRGSDGVEIKAYDNMGKFDKSCTLVESQGMIYDFLLMASAACKVELAQTRLEIQELPNAAADRAVYPENDIETWRDLVAWCAQTTCTFATIDRYGRLELRQYGSEPVDTIGPERRLTKPKIADYETRYTGLSCVNIAAQTTSYYGLTVDDGNTYNLGSNPLLQYGVEETLTAERRAILNELAEVSYYPMDLSLIGNPAYDLGDMVLHEGGVAENGKKSCITLYDWTFGAEYRVLGAGKNPELTSAKSKTDKDISGLMAQVNDDAIHYYDYINAVDYHITDGRDADIMNIKYITTKNTHIDFHAEIEFRLETTENEYENEDGYTVYEEHDGKVKVTYILGGEAIDTYYPMEQLQDGTHMIHLVYTWSSSANVIGTIRINLGIEGAQVYIAPYSVRAYMAGQGLAGDDAWDGTVKVKDEVAKLNMTDVLGLYSDNVLPGTYEPPANDFEENFLIPDMTQVLPLFSDGLGDRYWMHRFTVYTREIMDYDPEEILIDGELYKLAEGIESSTLTTPDREAQEILKVTSNNSGSNVGFIVSFDGGENWWTYTDDWTEPDYTQDMYGMFESKLRTISPEKWAEKLEGHVMIRALMVTGATLRDIQIYLKEIE